MTEPYISPRGRLPNGNPNPVDKHVGNRMRERRILAGMSQEKIAGYLGITFQQVQKYERGANRIGCSRLWDIACVLKCSPAYFFEGMPASVYGASPRLLSVNDEVPEVKAVEPLTAEGLEMIRLMRSDKLSPRIKQLIRTLIRVLADEDPGDE